MHPGLGKTFLTQCGVQWTARDCAHLAVGRSWRPCVRAAAKKQKPHTKKVRKPKSPAPRRIRLDVDDDDDYDDADGPMTDGKLLVLDTPSSSLPAAPPPTAAGSRGPAPRPEDLYPVFKQQKVVTPLSSSSSTTSSSSSSSSSQGGKWSWDDPGSSGGSIITDDVPLWNPRTGFTQPPTQDHDSSNSSSSSSSGVSSAKSPLPDIVLPSAASPGSTPAAAGGSDSGQDGGLPAVSQGAVLTSCLSTTGAMVLFGFMVRAYAEQNAAAAMGTDPQLVQQLLRLPPGLESWQNAGWTVGAAAGVTAARLVLLSQWPEFKEATDRSNQQVLTPLSWADVVVVSLLTGLSEEFLFRSGLITASYPDWRGALLAGALFGLLHNSGGRNLAFAAWASVVGVVYGGVFLATGNVWVAGGAHALANFASAASWRLQQQQRKDA